MPKVLPKPKKSATKPPRRVSFTETVHGVAPLPADRPRVDREAGIIYGVRVCGNASDNSRLYPPDVLKKAIPLYEKVKVRVNHPKRPHDDRDVSDTFGWLENVRPGDDGALYADLHFLRSHPYAEAVCEAAERNPALLGLSHNADGRGAEDKDGRFVIQEILAVRSVDIVDRPATSESIFESKSQPMQTTLRQLIEATAARKALFARHLLEMPEDMADLPLDAPAEPAAPVEGDWKADLVAAIGKLVSSEDEADHKLAQKIMGMLKPGAVTPPEPVAEEEDEDKEDDEDKEKPMEGRKTKAPAPAALTLTEAKARQLCDLAGMTADKELLEAVVGLPEEKALTILGQFKKRGTAPRNGVVRAQGPAGAPTKTLPADAKDYLKALRSA